MSIFTGGIKKLKFRVAINISLSFEFKDRWTTFLLPFFRNKFVALQINSANFSQNTPPAQLFTSGPLQSRHGHAHRRPSLRPPILVHSRYLYWNAFGAGGLPTLPSQKPKDKKPLQNSTTSSPPPVGFSGLARSEGSERRERLESGRHKEGNKREGEIGFPFLFPLWAVPSE